MKILFLIPARSGSKGLPGKNTKLLGDKPLIEYSIDFALSNMNLEDELCISTNDPEVINIAKLKGIKIPFIRPEELSNDTASSYDVIIHAYKFYESIGKGFDAILLLQPTSPFRKKEDFEKIKSIFDSDTDMIVSVKLAKENPYFSLYEESIDGLLMKSKVGEFKRRQDCPNVYAFNGSMYLINIESLKRTEMVNFKRIKKLVMSDENSIDIDTLADWTLAEFYLNNENS